MKEQLHEMEQKIREMERKMEEKDRELHAIKLDTEAVRSAFLCYNCFLLCHCRMCDSVFVLYFGRHGQRKISLENKAKSCRPSGVCLGP